MQLNFDSADLIISQSAIRHIFRIHSYCTMSLSVTDIQISQQMFLQAAVPASQIKPIRIRLVLFSREQIHRSLTASHKPWAFHINDHLAKAVPHLKLHISGILQLNAALIIAQISYSFIIIQTPFPPLDIVSTCFLLSIL